MDRIESTMAAPHIHRLKIYYGDTDFSGAVYYANYLRFLEAARCEALGTERMRADYERLGVGIVIHKAELTYRRPAHYGDELEIRSHGSTEGEYRLIYDQTVHRVGEEGTLLEATIRAVQVDRTGNIVPLQPWIREVAASTSVDG